MLASTILRRSTPLSHFQQIIWVDCCMLLSLPAGSICCVDFGLVLVYDVEHGIEQGIVPIIVPLVGRFNDCGIGSTQMSNTTVLCLGVVVSIGFDVASVDAPSVVAGITATSHYKPRNEYPPLSFITYYFSLG